VFITGQASSAAILLAMGFDSITMKKDAVMRFHPIESKNALKGHRATGAMAAIVAQRIGNYFAEVVAWMDEERQFTAPECLERRLCDLSV
jgi:ATP-dependent protease ClpP protease subunit